jgi:hypothetical protein
MVSYLDNVAHSFLKKKIKISFKSSFGDCMVPSTPFTWENLNLFSKIVQEILVVNRTLLSQFCRFPKISMFHNGWCQEVLQHIDMGLGFRV